MNQNIKSHLAKIILSIAAIGTELLGEEASPVIAEQPTPEPAPKRRGRPPAATPATTETSVETAAPEPEKTPEPAPENTDEERYLSNRALIEPIVKANKGLEVKKVINKYAPSLKEIPADKQAAFVKDMEALTY